MMIWAFTTSPPQHIGNTDGMDTMTQLIEGARRARYCLTVAARVAQGNESKICMFDTRERADDFFARNPDLRVSEIATYDR